MPALWSASLPQSLHSYFNTTGLELEGGFSASGWGSQGSCTVEVNKPTAPGLASHWPFVAVERSKGEGRGHTSVTSGTENPFTPSHGWNCSQALSWCSLPAALQRCQVTAKMQNRSSAYKTEAQGGQHLAWSNPEPPCPSLLRCGESNSYRSSTSLPRPNPVYPALQGMSPFLKLLSISYLKVCFAYNSLLFPCPPLSKHFFLSIWFHKLSKKKKNL